MAGLDAINESKSLLLELKENEDQYVSGDLDLDTTLDKTEQLFQRVCVSDKLGLASTAFQDSHLMKLQSKIAKESAKLYKIDALEFDPISFAEKLKSTSCPNEDDDDNANNSGTTDIWKKLGEISIKYMNPVPTCSFIYGTFDADSVEPVKEARKKVAKDKEGDKTKPQKVATGSDLNEEDVMLKDADRVYTVFKELVKSSPDKPIGYYEFVTDPDSFTRTVENMFLVSLLVREGYIFLGDNDEGLPFLRKLSKSEKTTLKNEPLRQRVFSLSAKQWKEIVETYHIKKAVIPPRTT